jgi:hypothetical protein
MLRWWEASRAQEGGGKGMGRQIGDLKMTPAYTGAGRLSVTKRSARNRLSGPDPQRLQVQQSGTSIEREKLKQRAIAQGA